MRAKTGCRIHAHGGKYAQVARNDPNILIVYGGQTTRQYKTLAFRISPLTNTLPAYDLRLIMDKGVCDIIRPQWILDCVANEKIVPLTKKYVVQSLPLHRCSLVDRYFFHATAARKETDEYAEDDSDTEEEPEDEPPSPSPSASRKSNSPPQEEPSQPKEEIKIDPSMAEWFDVGASLQQSGGSKGGYISGSDTEEDPESDNEDVDPEAASEDEDWEKVDQDSGKSQEESKVTIVLATNSSCTRSDRLSQGKACEARMGEDDNAMAYDEERIFKHL